MLLGGDTPEVLDRNLFLSSILGVVINFTGKNRKEEDKYIYKVELELIKNFKGNSKPKIITIYTHSNSSSCGYPWFVVGKEYLIYTSSEKIASYTFYKMKKKFLWTYHCLRTKAFDPLEAEELRKLSSKAKNNDPN